MVACRSPDLLLPLPQSCPGVGDDTIHSPLVSVSLHPSYHALNARADIPFPFPSSQPFFSTPDFIGTDAPSGLANDAPVDLVFVDFIQSDLLDILNSLQTDKTYAKADVLPYTDVLATAVLGSYAEKYWN